MASEFTSALAEALRSGVARIARLADGAANHDLVLGTTIAWADFDPLLDPTTRCIPLVPARAWLRDHILTARLRSYRPPNTLHGHEVLAYGYTANNKRELAFLQLLCNDVGADVVVENVCAWPYDVRVGIDPQLADDLMRAVDAVLGDRSQIAPGLLHQIGKFGTSVQSALDSLSAPAGVFAVANDHAPAPVGFAAVARARGFRTIYVQHAEVTSIFPPLDFDLSILRNAHSAEVYRALGPVQGEVVVAARHAGPWVSPHTVSAHQAALASRATVDVVLYPSSVLDANRFGRLSSELMANPSVSSLRVKPHPNAREPLPVIDAGDVEHLSDIPAELHVAICGNSSVVVELLERGCIVFQDVSLDGLTPDYYGFVAHGIAHAWSDDAAQGRFWADAVPLGAKGQVTLGQYVGHLNTEQNVAAARAVRPALLDVLDGRHVRAASQGAMKRWLRGLVGR